MKSGGLHFSKICSHIKIFECDFGFCVISDFACAHLNAIDLSIKFVLVKLNKYQIYNHCAYFYLYEDLIK